MATEIIYICNQMVTGEIWKDEENYKTLDGKQLKLFTNFTSIPFDYHLISWLTNYAQNQDAVYVHLDHLSEPN